MRRLFVLFTFVIGLSFWGIGGVFAQTSPDLKKIKISKRLSASELALVSRLHGAGFGDRSEIYIRLFKLERELEVWLKVGARYKLFRSYDICKYSGTLGPKVIEGDGQAPEGFYHVPIEDLIWRSKKWPEALNLSFPNVYDAQQGRTGSYLLIHGGCSSKGCYALENGPMSELFALITLSARTGQEIFPIHIFPFRFKTAQWEVYKTNKWAGFWKSLQPAFDYFNKHRDLPGLTVCASGYNVLQYRSHKKNERGMFGVCVAPVPLLSVKEPVITKLDWVQALKRRYVKAGFGRQRAVAGVPKIKVQCNLKRASCRKWLALKRKRLHVR